MSGKRKRKFLQLYAALAAMLLLAVSVLLAWLFMRYTESGITIVKSEQDAALQDEGESAEAGLSVEGESAEAGLSDEGERAVTGLSDEEESAGTVYSDEEGNKEAAFLQDPGESESSDGNVEILSGRTVSGENADLISESESSENDAIPAADESELSGSGSDTQVESLLAQLTLEEKIAQMFIITPEALTGVSTATAAGTATQEAYSRYPVGGLVYFTQNITSESQLMTMLENTLQYSQERIGVPAFLCVDEEGGTVTRISGKGVIDVPYIDTMQSVGLGEPEDAYAVGETIGSYLSELLFNVDFAPVADVATNPDNSVIGTRSFGSDAEVVSSMVASFVEGIQNQGVAATLKHFPGHGDTAEDSHVSRSTSYKTLEELWECELLPFAAGIEAGCRFVMVGHISLPNVTGDDTPATVSELLVTELLREEMGFDGIIVTDAMNMAAITDYYSSAEAAVAAVSAGADMILMPADFQSAYEGLVSAVNTGVLSEERIDESLRRILTVKLEMN